ncbi:MAG: ATP-dependent RecD-like DNA helicase [Lachnospiraceae bacterium]|nr:ATP-dependent RecD-like DNA helicase [Lachnospiraceae bacterium]
MEGYVEHIIFRNAENGYTVFELVSGEEEMTCTGVFGYLNEGDFISLEGQFVEHPMYGTQLQVTSYELRPPEDIVAIQRYLGSGAIKGIGETMAGRIVKKFGADTFRIMEEEPERLAEIKGISERKAREIAIQVEDKKELRNAMLFLTQYGISNSLAVKIYTKYGQQLYGVMQENPYQLAEDISGVGFKIADEIASRIGIHTDSDYRIRSGLLYVLLQAVGEGHTYLPRQELVRRGIELLGVEESGIEIQLGNLCIERKLIIKLEEEEERVYAAAYYYMELNTAKMLHDLNVPYAYDEAMALRRLQKIEENAGMELDELQREAVMGAVQNGVFILTGGPGTGKTTTINAMIRYFESEGLDIMLAAPTGRAAKRMTETTGYEASTIHRMLELMGGPDQNDKGSFLRNEENPLETDVIIIDEMSMVDLPLFHALLKAVLVGTRLILVGDKDQLPSVGAGAVLKDLLGSERFPTIMLTKIFRQAGESDIVVNAHKINNGERVTLDNKSMDFFFLKRQDSNVIISVLLTLIQKKLPKYVEATPYDIQVLTPTRKGLLGVERLNGILQQYLNPPTKEKKEKEYAGTIFREGDKVMQIKNNYQLEWEIKNRYGLPLDKGTGIFNGDMGIIKSMNLYAENMVVEFDDCREVEYSFKQMEELELAYAITIHKSQGSEYPAVVMPVWPGPRMLMNRNLLYTAVTRARRCVTMVGSEDTFYQMAENMNEQTRYSGLKERIWEF